VTAVTIARRLKEYEAEQFAKSKKLAKKKPTARQQFPASEAE